MTDTDGSSSSGDLGGETGNPTPHLAPGVHPSPGGGYSYEIAGRLIHADSETVGDMLGAGLRTWDDALVVGILGPARSNPLLTSNEIALLPWALTTLSAETPGALGLVGQASYSGPGATGLIGNLMHSSRGSAYAAELIGAATLVYRGSISTDGQIMLGDLRATGARLDFGVKFLGAGTRRRTAEADILVALGSGERAAVDVKFSRSGCYRAAPSSAILEVVAQAISRGEISSFHFVTPGRFRPAFLRALEGHASVYAHESVWPSAVDQASIAIQELAAIDYGKLLRDHSHEGAIDVEAMSAAFSDEAAWAYGRATGSRELVEITTASGFTYLFDKTEPAGPDDPGPRLVAGWGRTKAGGAERDSAFMRGYPLPTTTDPADRGHLIARSMGGDEGIGLNLIPQARSLNRGHGPAGRRWRRLERLAASSPGTAVFVRAVYDDASDVPVRIDYLVVSAEAGALLERFVNRPGAP